MKVKGVITALMLGVASGVAADCNVWPSEPSQNEVEKFILKQKADESKTFSETISGSTRLEERSGGFQLEKNVPKTKLEENVSKVEDGIAPAVSVTQRKTENGFEVCVTPED